MVRNFWWHLKPTHWTNTCQAHCRSGIQRMAFHNFSSSMHSPHATFSNASVPTEVLRIFIPCGLQTSRGKSHSWEALSCLVPHPRVSTLESNPRSLQTSKSWTVLVRSGMQTTHTSSRNAKKCSPGNRSRFTSHKEQKRQRVPMFASLVLRHLPTGTVLIFPRMTCQNCVDGSDKRNQPMELWDVHQLGQHRNQDVVINTDFCQLTER